MWYILFDILCLIYYIFYIINCFNTGKHSPAPPRPVMGLLQILFLAPMECTNFCQRLHEGQSDQTKPRHSTYQQTFQVPKVEVLTYISSMCGLCKGKPTPKIAGYKAQYLHFRYLKCLVNDSLGKFHRDHSPPGKVTPTGGDCKGIATQIL